MPRRCSICSDERRELIERAVVAGEAIRQIAQRMRVSADALRRHVRTHLSGKLRAAAEAEEILMTDLLREIQGFGREAARLQRRAERGNDLRAAIQALRERTRNVELLARALAASPQPPQAPINFVVDLSRDDEVPESTSARPFRLLPRAAPDAGADGDGDEDEVLI